MAAADMIVGLLVLGGLVGVAVLCGALALRLARRSEQTDLVRGPRSHTEHGRGAAARMLDELRAGSMRVALARLPVSRRRARGPADRAGVSPGRAPGKSRRD